MAEIKKLRKSYEIVDADKIRQILRQSIFRKSVDKAVESVEYLLA